MSLPTDAPDPPGASVSTSVAPAPPCSARTGWRPRSRWRSGWPGPARAARAGGGHDADPRPRLRARPRGSCSPRAWSPGPRRCRRSPTAPTSRSPRAGVQRRHGHLAGPPPRRTPPRYDGRPPRPRRAACAAPRASTTCWRCPGCGRAPAGTGLRSRPRWSTRCPSGSAPRRRCSTPPGACTPPASFEPTGTRRGARGHRPAQRGRQGRRAPGCSPAGPPPCPLLCVSGRIGFEIVQKAVAAGVGSAGRGRRPVQPRGPSWPTDAGLCTVGFPAPRRFVTYSAPERVGV